MASSSLVGRLFNQLKSAPARLPPGAGVLVAASGGADSTALVRLLVALQPKFGWRLELAHAHFGLRGADSDADEQFVRELAESLGLPVHVARFDLSRRRYGIEQHARDLRYGWFGELADERGLTRVVTGHQADDQAETVLFRILRGNGLHSLAAIQPDRPIHALWPHIQLIRPLLEFKRRHILSYLTKLGQPYRTDRSNLDPEAATRNLIRQTILPTLRTRFYRVPEHLIGLSDQAAALTELADRWLADEAARRRDRLPTDLPVLADVPAWRIDGLADEQPATRGALERLFIGERSGSLDDLIVRRRVSSVRLGDGCTALVWQRRLAVLPRETLCALSPNRPVALTPGGAISWKRLTLRLDDDAPDGLVLRETTPTDTISPRPGARARPVAEWLKKLTVPEVLRRRWPVVAQGETAIWLPGLRAPEPPSYLHVSAALFSDPNPVAR